MSPEDDLQTISETINKDRISPSSNQKANKIKPIGNESFINDKKIDNTNGYKNGENCVHGETPTWLPLLTKDSHDSSENGQHNSNNNKWLAHTAPNLTDKKYGWEELPQDDDHLHQRSHLNDGSNIHNNGFSDKNEQESLTGVLRMPEPDELSSCGVGLCQPKWARSFASTHVFMVVFLFAWVLQGMYYTYFVSVITTIEKLFQIKSKTTGFLMSATEVGQIGTALLLTYYAGRGHRPRWIAFGMVIFAIASFGCTLPHFFFGNQLLHSNNALHSGGSTSMAEILVSDSDGALTAINSRNDSNLNLCRIPNGKFNWTSENACEEKILIEQEANNQIRRIVLCIFFVSLILVGIGQTAVSTLGIPYIDDNVASRESPIYIAITIGVRILGPAAGFILGSFCTRFYVDFSDPGFDPSDPKWIGAWHLGLVLIAVLMVLTSLVMFTFPKHLNGNRIPPPMKMRAIEAQKKLEKQEEESKPQLKDFPKAIKRQLSNDILMFRTASSVLHLLPLAGLYTFLPKYLESQFNLPAHDANLISGLGGILVMGVGIIISGVVILKVSPTARSVAAWIAFTAIVYSAGMAVLMFVGCSMDNFVGLEQFKMSQEPRVNMYSEPTLTCNTRCDCDRNKFSPICGSDGMTYFSSCHAGCNSSFIEKGKTQYYNCACIQLEFPVSGSNAVSGYCEGHCQNFVLFIVLFSFLVFMHSTSEVGSMLLIMRCTDPKDKAMAMGIIQFAIGLFGNVPCPIIYGAVIDSACLVWETICGKQGACSLYDPDTFRHFFLGTTSGIMFLAFIVDVVVWHKAHRIDIDPESNSTDTNYDKPVAVPESTV